MLVHASGKHGKLDKHGKLENTGSTKNTFVCSSVDSEKQPKRFAVKRPRLAVYPSSMFTAFEKAFRYHVNEKIIVKLVTTVLVWNLKRGRGPFFLIFIFCRERFRYLPFVVLTHRQKAFASFNNRKTTTVKITRRYLLFYRVYD